MKKYRVRLSDGKVYGPFLKNQIEELLAKAKIDESADCQTFPIGEWTSIKNFPEFSIKTDPTSNEVEKKKDDDQNKTKATVVMPRVGKREVNIPDIPDSPRHKVIEENIDETLVESFKKNPAHEKESKNEEPESETLSFEIESGTNHFDGVIEEDNDEDEEQHDKTRVINSREVNLDKTVIRDINVEFAEDQIEKKPKLEEEVEEIKEIVVSSDDETKFLDINELKKDELPYLQKRKLEYEYRELEQEIKKDEKFLKKRNQEIEDFEEDEEDEDEAGDSKKKRNFFIIIFCVFLIIYLDDDSDEIKVKEILKPNIIFPLQINKDEKLAQDFYQKGLAAYSKGTYYSLIESSSLFVRSLQHNIKDNPALSDLILVYGEILPMTKDIAESARVQYKLINLAKSKLYTDYKVALGSALFYYHMDKKLTARTILENYLKLSKINSRVYSLYLKVLIDEGNKTLAKGAFEVLSGAKKSLDVIDALASYHVMNEDFEKAIEIYDQNHKHYEDSMIYNARYGDLLLGLGDLDRLEKIAKALVALRGDGSPMLFAKGLKFAGFINAAKGSTEKASKLFASSLAQFEDDSLKDTLAALDLGGGDLSEQLIKYTKIDSHISSSKEYAKKGDWEKAFLLALEAVDLNPKSKKAKTYLSEIQSQRGYLKESIDTLKELSLLYPKDVNIAYAYLMSLIRAYQFKEVNEFLSSLHAENKLKTTSMYYEVLGEYFFKRENLKVTVRHYLEALKLNPIEDKYFYKLAKISCSLNRFKKCRSYINEARSLDPVNVKYKSLYAQVLFELEGIDVAAGYLLRQLEELKDEPRLIGKLATIYYQNQSYKQYRIYKEKLESLNIKDESLYNYLIETAKIDGNKDLLIESAQKLLLINPGNIETKMTLARAYAGQGKKDKALEVIEDVIDQMPRYPKIYYEKAAILLDNNDIDGAIEAAKKEVATSESEYGYYILGMALLKKNEGMGDKSSFADAEKAFQLANAKKPNFFENLLELGYIKYRQRDFGAARELYLRAARINPDSSKLARRLGDVFKEIGQSSQAIEQYQKYLRLRPTANDKSAVEAIIKQLQ